MRKIGLSLALGVVLAGCMSLSLNGQDSCGRVGGELQRIADMRQRGLISATEGDKLHRLWAEKLEALTAQGCP